MDVLALYAGLPETDDGDYDLPVPNIRSMAIEILERRQRAATEFGQKVLDPIVGPVYGRAAARETLEALKPYVSITQYDDETCTYYCRATKPCHPPMGFMATPVTPFEEMELVREKGFPHTEDCEAKRVLDAAYGDSDACDSLAGLVRRYFSTIDARLDLAKAAPGPREDVDLFDIEQQLRAAVGI